MLKPRLRLRRSRTSSSNSLKVSRSRVEMRVYVEIKTRPRFQVFVRGKLKGTVDGANPPAIKKMILENVPKQAE